MAEESSGGPASADTHVASGSLIIVTPKVIIAKGEDETPRPYRLRNGILFATTMALVTIWFAIHVKTFFTQIVLLGTVTVWSALQVFLAQFKSAIGDDAKKAWTRFLDSPRTGTVFQIAIVGVLSLFVVTSSVYVKRGETKESTVQIEVTDLATNAPYVNDLKLDFATTTDGRPIVPSFRSRDLLLKVKRPAGYHDERLRLRPGEALELSFPEQFHRRSLVRIFIPHRLKPRTPMRGESELANAKLVIDAAGRRGSVSGFGFRTAYVGVTDESLARELISQSLASFEDARRSELRGIVQPGAKRTENDLIESRLAEWRNAPFITTAWNLKEGDALAATFEVSGVKRFACSAKVVGGRVTDCILVESE